MDVFVNFTTLNSFPTKNCIPQNYELIRYYAITRAGRKIIYAFIKHALGSNQYLCYPAKGWIKYLQMLGLNAPEETLFTNQIDAQQYTTAIFRRLQQINYPSPCNNQIHLPDVSECTITWFAIQIDSSELHMKIPDCMHRHLMQHLTTTAVLLHYTVAIQVSVENMHFTSGICDFMIENHLFPGDIVLFRHTGFFNFETFFYKSYSYTPRRKFNQYGESVTPRVFEIEQITMSARSSIPPRFQFEQLERCSSLYTDFCTFGAHDRLCGFLSDSNVLDGPLKIIVGDRRLRLYFDKTFYIEQWEQITDHFDINESDDVVCFNIDQNVVLMLVIGNCYVENIYPWSVTYTISENVYGEINWLSTRTS